MSARRALAYFTILPGGAHDGPPDAATIAWFPWIGALLGACYGLSGWLAWRYAGAPWQAVVPLGLAIVLTGALHLDGFLDCCDALFANVSADRRREILKDPRHGSFALAGALVLGAVWLAALLRFPYALGPWWSAGLFAIAGFAARAAAVANMDRARRTWAASAAGLLVFPIAAVAYVLKRFATNRLDGAESGDIYGALVILLEVAILVGYGGLAR